MTATIVVLGGYGTFGARVSRDLAARGHRVVVAGRDLARASALAASLGDGHAAVCADASDEPSCRAAVEGAAVVAVCAGPFSAIGTAAARAAVAEGAHYVDISDDRAYIRSLHALDEGFARAGRCAAFGCSSLPGVSSALAGSLTDLTGPPERVRVTLFIGNANPKGPAAVRALVERLGRPVATPQGDVAIFNSPERVSLPPPFGPRTVYAFDGPELDLFPRLFGVPTVAVKVGFELRLANAVFAAMARSGVRWGRATASLLSRMASWAPRSGTSGGAVMVEAAWPDGHRAARAVVGDEDGQRMAALPCAAVAHALASGASTVTGVRPPTDVVAATALLAELEAAGLRVVDLR